MSKRSERRGVERVARKPAYQEARNKPSHTSQAQTEISDPIESPARTAEQPVISAAQLAANRANAQHSTGPATPEGKAESSTNSLKHGLTAKTVRNPTEDPDQYQHQLAIYT